MAPMFVLSGWHLGNGMAVYYRFEEGWLVMHAFARTEAGVVDLVAFRCEPCTPVSTSDVADRVQQICETWHIEPTPSALTSRRLREHASTGASLAAARHVLGRTAMAPDRTDLEQPDRARLVELARFVLAYADELGRGAGARRRMADARGIGVDAVKSRIQKARSEGLWISAGGGRPGQPSRLALELAHEGE